MDNDAWKVASGESANYIEEIRKTIQPYSYSDKGEVANTHKSICSFLASRLSRAAENVHLSDDFYRGPRTGESDKIIRGLKDDIEIFRDEVTSSYVDWRNPRSAVIKDIILKDAQIIRYSDALLKASEFMRESAISKNISALTQKAAEANEVMKKLSYLFYERERLCR
jgi:hypothetical protein